MRGATKLLVVVLLVGLYFGLGVFGPLYEDPTAQAAVLGLCALLRLRQGGWPGLWGDLRFLVPFVLVLVLMGLALDALAVAGRSDWTADALAKAVVFPNSFWSIQLAVGAVRLADLVALPAAVRRPLVLGHAMLHKSRPLLERLWWLTCRDPHLAGGPWPSRQGRRLAVLLTAALAALYRETEATVRLYDARMALLEEESP